MFTAYNPALPTLEQTIQEYIYHLFTETEENSVFCGPETAVVARGEAEGNNGGRVISSSVIGVNLINLKPKLDKWNAVNV